MPPDGAPGRTPRTTTEGALALGVRGGSTPIGDLAWSTGVADILLLWPRTKIHPNGQSAIYWSVVSRGVDAITLRIEWIVVGCTEVVSEPSEPGYKTRFGLEGRSRGSLAGALTGPSEFK